MKAQNRQHKGQRWYEKLSQRCRKIRKDWTEPVSLVVFPQRLPVYFPCSVSSSVYEGVIRAAKQKAHKGQIVTVEQQPKYIDGIPYVCYCCKKRLESQEPWTLESGDEIKLLCDAYDKSTGASRTHQEAMINQSL